MDTITPEYFYDFLLRHPRVSLHFQHWFNRCKPCLPTSGCPIDTKLWTISMMILGSASLHQADEATWLPLLAHLSLCYYFVSFSCFFFPSLMCSMKWLQRKHLLENWYGQVNTRMLKKPKEYNDVSRTSQTMDKASSSFRTQPRVSRRSSSRVVDSTLNWSVGRESSVMWRTSYLKIHTIWFSNTHLSAYLLMDWKRRKDRTDGFPSSEAIQQHTERDLIVVKQLVWSLCAYEHDGCWTRFEFDWRPHSVVRREFHE